MIRGFIKKLLLKIFTLLTLLLLVITAFNPCRWTNGMLKNLILMTTPIGSDIALVRNRIELKEWNITKFDELNGYEVSNEKCSEIGLGKISDERRYYNCSKKIPYKYACELSGGSLESDNNLHGFCVRNNQSIFVDANSVCLNAGGKLILKSTKLSRHCKLGNGYLVAEIGNYFPLLVPLPIVAYVYAIWVFGEDGHLIDIIIEEEIDSV